MTALADCVPFLGVEDLREILTGVLRRTAATVQDSRPLKVRNYLQVSRRLFKSRRHNKVIFPCLILYFHASNTAVSYF